MENENLTQYEYPQNQQPTVEKKETVETKPVEQPKESSKEKENNLRLLRERAERAERRALELENQSRAKQDSLDDESFIEGKHFKALQSDFNQVKQALEEERQQRIEQTLLSRYSDIKQVVTNENLAKLAEQYPEDYKVLVSNTDLYARGSAAYNMIKNYGIINKYAAEDKKITENLKKPVSGAALDGQTADNPLTRVGDYDRRVLTEDRKAQLRRQVEEAKRNGG